MLTLSKSCLDVRQSALDFPLSLPFKDLALLEGAKAMFGLPVVSKDGSPRFMNFGLLLMKEFARFARLLGTKSATISSGRLFTPTFSMQKQSELLYWAADPSTEVFNSSMFLNHLAKLELLPRLGLKISTLTPG